MAQAFHDAEWYESELVRTHSVVARHPDPRPYPGPFPPMLDDVIRHAANCGISPDLVAPALSDWSAYFRHNVAPAGEPQATGPAADRPGDNATRTTITASADGLGAATPGDDNTATTQQEPPSGASGDSPTEDVEMQDLHPPVDETSHAGGVAS
ncbi:hypothetical protein OH77DRAFT_1525959 [Trametes cingulata]|nr:hypothetical protein OH77DRAFT_1525959 [Trametes cingulata]